MTNKVKLTSRIKGWASSVRGKLSRCVSTVKNKGTAVARVMKPKFPEWVRNHYRLGYPTAACGLMSSDSVILSDYDGSDPCVDWKDFIAGIRNKASEHNKVFNIYYNTGVLDANLIVEFMSVVVYCGIPFILSSPARLAGTNELDAQFDTMGGSLISRIANKNCDIITSAGFVGMDIVPERYAYDFYKNNTLLESVDLDAGVLRLEANAGRIVPVGHLYTPGGDMFDIFSLNAAQSKMIRRMKDFSQNPLDEMNIPEGMQEIVMLGGDPDIVNIGSFTTVTGVMYEVWVPNEARNYWLGRKILEEDWLPVNSFNLDFDDMIESYAMMYSVLMDLDKQADSDGESDEEDDEAEEVDVSSGLYVLEDQNDYNRTEPMVFPDLPF